MSVPQNITSARQLSVVVGSVESARSIESCIQALLESSREYDAELIVVDAGGDPVVAAAVAAHPEMRFVALPSDTLTPRLWAEGITLSSGSIVALTTGHCFVSRDWASSLISAVGNGASGVGGPLRLEPHATTLDAAIFFLRYSAFIEGRPNGKVEDIAGDNAAYNRRDIPPQSWSRELGFWERDVNRAIRASGKSLAWSVDAVADFGRSFSFGSICRHRFSHGRLFGRSRVANDGESRVKIVLGSVIVPLLLAMRAGRRVVAVERYRTRFVGALPLMIIIAACWAVGEATGALEASVADRR